MSAGSLPTVLRTQWRSGRRTWILWTVGLIAVFAATVGSLDSLYDTRAALTDYAKAISAGAAATAINGEPYGADNLGGVVAYEFGFMSSIAVPLMGLLLVTRWTRNEEQTGRLELIRAGAVRRDAPLASALLLVAVAYAIIAVGVAGSLLAFDVAATDAICYALALALLGWWFAALTGAAAQVVERGRAVHAVTIGVLVVSFVLRGVGDVRDNALVWLSPLGWAEETRAFADTRWWPLLIPLLSSALLCIVAFRLCARRDLGSGLFAARPGAGAAGASLLGRIGLTVHTHRGITIGWAVIAALVGGAFGSVAESMEQLATDNATVREVLGGGSERSDAFLAFIVVLVALLIAGYAVQAAGRISTEEREGRLETLLAGSVARPWWLLGHIVVIACGAVVVGLAGGVALGIGVAGSTGDTGEIVRLTGACLAYVPAALVLSLLATALYALRPALQPIGWLVYAFVAVVAMLGDTLQLADWVEQLSPLDWVGRVPVESVAWWAPLTSAGIAICFVAIAAYAFRERDIPA